MTINQFRPESSSRGALLYSKLKSHLKDDMTILDIGCAYSCMAGLIRKDFPKCQLYGFDNHGSIIEEMKRGHPYYAWVRVMIENGDELKGQMWEWIDKKVGSFIGVRGDRAAYNVVIHIGVDAESWSPIWKVHPWLIENHPPKVVFLETGRRDGYEGCMATYEKIKALYIDAGYKLADIGQFDFDWGGACLKDRHYSILVRNGNN